jgi:hypothetical protein
MLVVLERIEINDNDRLTQTVVPSFYDTHWTMYIIGVIMYINGVIFLVYSGSMCTSVLIG